MGELALGTPVHITNPFDRLFYDEIGTITESRQNQDHITSYYVDVPRLAYGRWFGREEFELVDKPEVDEEKLSTFAIEGEPAPELAVRPTRPGQDYNVSLLGHSSPSYEGYSAGF